MKKTGCKVICDYNDLLIYNENICAFPHILGSPSSYMTLHTIPSKFPYMWGKFYFLFLSVYTFRRFKDLSGRRRPVSSLSWKKVREEGKNEKKSS
jgi:hypothetical protein